MITPTYTVLLIIGLSLPLIAVLVVRPSITATRGGKMLAFVNLFLLPALAMFMGAAEHMERSKKTEFCLSCHAMEPHGKSLYVDDPSYLAAAHFQNHRVPAGQACYSCHTEYTLYGGLRDKIRGLRHVYVQYLGAPPAPAAIRLYTPYRNRECLHCHGGARSFVENPIHSAMMEQLMSNQLSCLSTGCHNVVHNVAGLKDARFWKEQK